MLELMDRLLWPWGRALGVDQCVRVCSAEASLQDFELRGGYVQVDKRHSTRVPNVSGPAEPAHVCVGS